MTSEQRSTRTVIYAHLKHLKNKVRNYRGNEGEKEEHLSQEEIQELLVDEKSPEQEVEEEEASEEEEEVELTEEEINAAVSELRVLDGRLAAWLEVRENTILQLRETADYIDQVGKRTNIAKAEYADSTADSI